MQDTWVIPRNCAASRVFGPGAFLPPRDSQARLASERLNTQLSLLVKPLLSSHADESCEFCAISLEFFSTLPFSFFTISIPFYHFTSSSSPHSQLHHLCYITRNNPRARAYAQSVHVCSSFGLNKYNSPFNFEEICRGEEGDTVRRRVVSCSVSICGPVLCIF